MIMERHLMWYNFQKVNLHYQIQNGKKWKDCYDYYYLPTKDKEGILTVLVSGGYEGGYNDGKTRAKYISKDNGFTWKFVSEVIK